MSGKGDAKTNRVVVYTDGSCMDAAGKPKGHCGIGVCFLGEKRVDHSGELDSKVTTPSEAEIWAAIKGVQMAKERGCKFIEIVTDSLTIVDAMNGNIKIWKTNGWLKIDGGGAPVVHKDAYMKLDKACEGVDVQFTHVKGHSGIAGNIAANQLAREGAK